MKGNAKYTLDAFKALSLLEDMDFDLTDKNSFQKLDTFINDDGDIPETEIIDLEAENEEDLKDSYLGDIILSCPVCHTNMFKPIDDIVIDEETELCCVGEECPVCGNADGFKILGKVAPFEEEEVEEAETEVKTEPDEAEVEVKEKDVEDIKEAIRRRMKRKKLQEEKKQLIERQWKYQLKNGRKLRDAIEENEEPPFNDVLDALRDCIEELREHVTVENGFDEDDFEWNFEDLLEDIDIWYDDESEEAEDEVNYILEKFYDSCDALDIWVSIVENLEEALPKDLAKAYKSANYNEYADVMAGERAGETRNAGWVDFSGEYHAPDVANMSPKEVGPYIDYQKADYQLLTAEQAKKLPKNKWKNLRMLDRHGDLIVLTPSGSVNTRVNGSWNGGWSLAGKSAPEVFDLVDKIYLTNEKSGEAFLSQDQISKRLQRRRHFYDPSSAGFGYYRDLDYYPNSPERLSGRHGAYDVKGSRLSWSAQNLDRYKTEAEDTQKLLNDLEQEYAAGDLSPNEYQKRKENLENTLARLKADIEAGERDLTQSRSELQGEKARARYANVEVAMSELQDKLVDLVGTRRNAESNLEQARRELQNVETGQTGEIHNDDTRWWKTVGNVNTKRAELEKAYKELEQLKAKIAQLESETSDEAYATQLQDMRDKVESEQGKVASAQAEVDKLLKRAPKNESLTEGFDNWTDAYKLFTACADRFFPDEEKIRKAAQQVHEIFKGDPQVEEAWKRWNDTDSVKEYEEVDESLNEAVGEKTFEEWFNETQEYWGNKDPNLSTFENYMRDFPNVETLRDATVKDIIKHAHEFYDVYPVDSEDREKAFNFVCDETGRDYDDLYYAWLREKPITESLDEAKNIEGIKGSIAAVAQAHKDELNAAMDMAFNKQSLIDSFMKIMNAHKDELNDEGKKRLDLAKEQMNKMRTLSAVASFITTLITGQKLNSSLIKKAESLAEDIEKATIETENEVINLSSKEKDMNADFDVADESDKAREEEKMFGLGEFSDDAEEVVAPLSDDDVAEIKANSKEGEEAEEEEETLPEDEDEFEFDEVQEESFNRLGEQYLKKVYSNVDTFKLDGVSADSSKLVLEGVITFKSGKTKKTSFVFEKVENKNSIAKSKARYVGLNETFTDKKNAYVLNVKKNGKTLVAESLRYNYPAKTKNLNEEVKVVKGLVK